MIEIKGIIGGEKNQYGLAQLISDVKKEADNKPLHIVIDSVGGYANIAFDMYNYLRSLKREIITECKNKCYSAATILFLAGDKRIADCPIMIHNPYVTIEGSADELEKASVDMKQIENRFTKFYSEHTKIDENTLADLMKNETYITPAQAVSLGFATEQSTNSKAVAFFKPNYINNLKKTSKMGKDKSLISAAKAFFKVLAEGDEVKALELELKSGEMLIIEREEGEPEVGDVATPDGEHELPDGTIIKVVDGVITEIVKPETVEDEIAALKAQISEKDNEIAALKASAKSNDEKLILNAVKMAGGTEWLGKVCSCYKPANRQNNFETERQNRVNAKLVEARKRAGKE